ncbi:2315_t:CDS:2 [Diversispora eburnea]|uniref:2315_t:CDS:1 n=1 Tax=Diversispora eburnea TaxID=1213867 RepID=A0A9N9B026_9GLOM|nr:2315_t:CDS:2 [Diversispora eburnea]
MLPTISITSATPTIPRSTPPISARLPFQQRQQQTQQLPSLRPDIKIKLEEPLPADDQYQYPQNQQFYQSEQYQFGLEQYQQYQIHQFEVEQYQLFEYYQQQFEYHQQQYIHQLQQSQFESPHQNVRIKLEEPADETVDQLDLTERFNKLSFNLYQ